MKKSLFPAFITVLVITFASCGKIHTQESSNDGAISNWDTIYTYSCQNGCTRTFCDTYCSGNHFLFAMDKNDFKDAHLVDLVYHRYDSTNFLEDGNPCALSYLPSPDGRYLYIVTRVFANSNGWTTEYQLFKVDCETLDAKFICDCAAIAVIDAGFVVAQARLTNRETATCTADEIWIMHDVYFDWEGRLTRISSEEYDYEAMDEKYQSGEYSYVKGFNETINLAQL